MKRKSSTIYLFFFLSSTWFLFTGFPNNPPNGRTGAPGESTCAACHTGNNPNGYDGGLTLTGLPATITPNTNYTITVTASNPNGLASRAGFQWVALDQTNTNVGNMTVPSANSTITPSGGRTYHEHNPAQNFPGSNEVSWTVNWTSPSTPVSDQTITFYGASVIASGNAGNQGDLVVTTTSSGTLAGGGAPLSVNITNVQDVNCNGGNDGQATANATGGTPPYNFMWSNGNPNATATNLSAGPNSVTVTDNIGFMISGMTTISQPSALGVNLLNQTNINCFFNQGSATVQGSGGTPGYSYAWSTGASGPTANNLIAGTNTVTVTDANLCQTTFNINITTDITAPMVNAGSDQTISCLSPQINLLATSPGCTNCSFNWENAGSTIISNTADAVVNTPGTYTATVLDNTNGCTNTDQVTVNADTDAPSVNAGSNVTLTCAVTTTQLNGAFSGCTNCDINWTTPDGNIVDGQNTLNPTVNAAGTYTLEVTNLNNGCSETDQVIVNDDTNEPSVNAGSDVVLTCSVTTTQLNGAFSGCTNCDINWTTLNGNIVDGQNTLNPTVDAAGTYTLEITNTDNSCTSSDIVMVSFNTTTPDVDAGSDAVLNCNITSLVLNASATNCASCSFAWSTSNGNIVSGQNTATPTVNAAGTYTVEATNNENDCTNSDVIVISENIPVSVQLSLVSDVTCNGGSDGTVEVSLENGSTPFTFEWSNGNMNQNPGNLEAGNYTISVTDADGCLATASISISEPPVLAANASATNESSAGANDGTASVNPSGGTPSYTILWSTNSGDATITGLVPGTYSATITDANGCEVVESVTVNSFNCLISASTSQVNVSCNGASDGEASVILTNAVNPISYEWSTGGMEATETGLSAGTYSVSVVDGNNCPTTANVTITEPDAITISLVGSSNATCNGEMDGSAQILAEGGTPAYTYAWPGGSGTDSDTNLGAGNHIVSVTDANGCEETLTVVIGQPDVLTTNFTIMSESSAGANDGSATAEPQGGTEPYSYSWSNGQDTQTAINLAPGEYTVIITDANDCSIERTVSINAFNCGAITLETTVIDEICPGTSSGAISIDAVNNATEPITYLWSNGAMTNAITDLSEGSYSVEITDADNCSLIANFEIVEVDNEAPIVVGMNISLDLDENGTASISASDVDNGNIDNCELASISIDQGEFDCTNLGENTVTLTAIDASGNSATTNVIVTVMDNFLPDIFCPENITTNECDRIVEYPDPLGFDNCDFTIIQTEGMGSGNVFPLGTSTETFTLTDAGGNTANCSFTITVETDLNAQINTTDVTCNGFEDGTATILITGGVPPYSTSGGFGDNLPAGSYFGQVEDAVGCLIDLEFTINEPPAIEISIIEVISETGMNMDGSIDISVDGGVGDFNYEWFFDGMLISTEEDISDLEAGVYTLNLTDENGCFQTVEVTLDRVTSTINRALEAAIQLFPNPSEGLFQLQINLTEAATVELMIYDFTGKLIRQNTRESEADHRTEIDLSTLPSGVYFLKVHTGDQIAIKKMLVHR